jgi:hypothetical protein
VADVRVLLAGWFSFDELIATVGDELGADVVAGWLTDLGIDHDVAWTSHMERGVDWRDVDPAACTHLVFVSGPLADRPLLRELSEVFAGAQRWAVDVSVVEQSAQGLFDRVWERDAPGLARPDLAVEGPEPQVPVVGGGVHAGAGGVRGAQRGRAGPRRATPGRAPGFEEQLAG